ncbi:gamma-butyrobetaine hydroxylase [Lentinula aciculospora]|uniref:Gamma-butyrobetaine hydroxylase n=1 Tax=Lentinula aciculospora TaxID=153920 RepID=A0A9W9AW94_9AGAR|nr:gamma-butyrobetaine hydroxylase [Lentinula aciculospora]
MSSSISRLTSGRRAYSLSRPIITKQLFVLPAFRRAITTATLNDDSLTIPGLNNATFPYIWLRDSCHSPACKHPETTQKLHSSTDFDVDIRPKTVKIVEDGASETGRGVHIEWPDGHLSFFPESFLKRHSSKEYLTGFRKDVQAETWDKQDIESAKDLYLNHDDMKTPAGLLKAINQLCQHGLLFLKGVPTNTTPTELTLNELALKFSSEIRETFYGRIFHVQNTNSENIAYTNLKLGLHVDMLYFEHPPRYQILHCIRNRVQGGSSIFSDSFHAAKMLKSFYPEDYDILTKTPVPFEYLYGDHHLHFSHPTIEEDHYNPALQCPPIKCVNYGPPFQAPLLLSPSSISSLSSLSPSSSTSTLRRFYLALGRFANLLNSPEHTYEYTLQEGDAVIFDNRRVLHSRTAFTDRNGSNVIDVSSDGNLKKTNISRWLQGCYFEGDTMKDRGRMLRAKKIAGLI